MNSSNCNAVPCTALPLTGGSLFIDASTLTRFLECPRAYEFYAVRRREAATEEAGRLFGSAIHACLDLHYRMPSVSEEDYFAACRASLEAFYSDPAHADLAACSYRTIDYALDLLALYRATYVAEPFTPLVLNGEPAVEMPFAVPIGHVLVADVTIPIVWTGKIDLAAEWLDGDFTVIDHKTSKVAGTSFFNRFTLDQAQLGYCYVARELFRRPVSGFMINALFVREPTRTGKKHELARQRYPVENVRLDEWRDNTLAIVRNLVLASYHGFPMHTTACVNRFGRLCGYNEICRLAPTQRETMLASNLYRDVTWTPLR